MTFRTLMASASIVSLAMMAGCAQDDTETAETPAVEETNVPTVEEARAFLDEADTELAALSKETAPVYWEQATNITDETNAAAAEAGARSTKIGVEYANATKRFKDVDLPPDLRRKMQRLQGGLTLPAPSTEGAAEELAEITTGLDATYSTGTYGFKNNIEEVEALLTEVNGAGSYDIDALTLDQLSTIIEQSRNPEILKEAWEGWRTVSPPMKDDYARMVEIATAGAKELGYKNVAEMWLSGYDMPADEMEAEVERLWTQVSPLYDELHCFVRGELSDFYGSDVQPDTGPIRADLLGNMWAQSWGNIYDLVKPDEPMEVPDVTGALRDQGYDEIKMVKQAESFFSSLGFEHLPETFWERSQFSKPADRDVQCHASAWNVDDKDDLRIKMCIQITGEEFNVIHHELGHNYYQRAYNQEPLLYRGSANDGFHEAIGDTIALSITPKYLKEIGLIDFFHWSIHLDSEHRFVSI